MDSKLRRMAILSSLTVILLVALAVLYVNGALTAGDSRNRPEHAAGEAGGQTQSSAEPPAEANVPSVGKLSEGSSLSAFLEDALFFDPESNSSRGTQGEEAEMLSLVVTSVEKDLRIQIVDLAGAPVAGKSLYVALKGLGEYKDLDLDGVIYIGELAAGDYYVKLLPVEGYQVPEGETRVRVKDKVEYVAIDDISLLIKTEADIDAQKEDTAVADALEDADKTEIKKLQGTGAGSHAGIDVSKWNGSIDWDKVRNAGVEFVIIRAGYRGSATGSLVEDPCFAANIKGALASGLQVGVYFFTQAVSEVEAVEEASAVLRLVKEYKLDYPIFIDTEGAGGNGRADGLDVETRTLVCEAFCSTVRNAGYEAGVYASRNWYNERLYADRLDDYYIWLAEYRSAPLYQGYYQMWQYTSKGKVDGIEGNVDMNISYKGPEG